MISRSGVYLTRRVMTRRLFSSEPVAASANSAGGSTLGSRVSSFLVGCGVGFGVNTFMVHEEIVEANKRSAQLHDDVTKLLEAAKK